jgi:hypothetical protein
LRINGTGRGRGETGDERDEEKDIYTLDYNYYDSNGIISTS